jgi:hypothetical protein
VALRSLPPTKAPTLVSGLRLATFTVDEWYGVDVSFTWTASGKARYDRYRNAVRATVGLQGPAWRSAQTTAEQVERELALAIASEVVASPEAVAYYATPRNTEVEEHGGGRPNGRRTIPIFSPAEYGDWHFTDTGGSISASDRD